MVEKLKNWCYKTLYNNWVSKKTLSKNLKINNLIREATINIEENLKQLELGNINEYNENKKGVVLQIPLGLIFNNFLLNSDISNKPSDILSIPKTVKELEKLNYNRKEIEKVKSKNAKSFFKIWIK